MFAFSMFIYCIDYRTRGDDTKGTQIQLVEPCLIVTTAIVEYSAF